jgi:hypothetical protein
MRQIDNAGRQEGMKCALGSNRKMVASDSTMERVLMSMEYEAVVKLIAGISRKMGLCYGRADNGIGRAGILDGSGIGKQMMSVLVEAGKIPVIHGIEPIEKRGKELAGSAALLNRAYKKNGRGYFKTVSGDGLYANAGFFAQCAKLGVDGVVKTDETTLNIIKDADGLFDSEERLPGVRYSEGTDAARNCRYRIWTAGNLTWSTTDIRLRVTRVEERFIKGKYAGQVTRFYVLSQGAMDDPETLRNWGHGRWFIENRVFKALNAQCRSKRLFSHNKHAALIMSMLQMIGKMLLDAYIQYVKQRHDQLRSLWDHRVVPARTVSSLLFASIYQSTMESG